MATHLEPARYLTAEERAGPPARHRRWWAVVTALEVIAAGTAIALDLLVPTFILLAMAVLSLRLRHAGFASLGFHRAPPGPLVARMFLFAAAWSVFQLAVTMPVANHVSGSRTDLSDFASIEGNVGVLLGYLLLGWTLAAVGEELAYRGYLQSRIRECFGSGRAGLVVAILGSSLLFGFAHSEQGLIGVVVITLDAIAFSVVRYRCRTLWASVLAHGFNNSIGFVAFFIVGPVYGLW